MDTTKDDHYFHSCTGRTVIILPPADAATGVRDA